MGLIHAGRAAAVLWAVVCEGAGLAVLTFEVAAARRQASRAEARLDGLVAWLVESAERRARLERET